MASWSWCSKNNCVEFDAPIGITDVQSGIRVIKESGKSSKSRFKLLNYDKMSNISTISCFPMTGYVCVCVCLSLLIKSYFNVD